MDATDWKSSLGRKSGITGISEGQTQCWSSEQTSIKRALRKGTSCSMVHLKSAPFPGHSHRGALWQFGDSVLCPSCSPGEYPSSGTGICSVLWPHSVVFVLLLLAGAEWGEQKFSAAACWGRFWAIRLTQTECWIICVCLISLQTHPWASPGSLSLPRKLSRRGTKSCQLAVWKIAAAMQLNVCLHFQSNFASSSKTAVRFVPNKIPSDWWNHSCCFSCLSTNSLLKQEYNRGANKISLSRTTVPLSVIFN